MDIVPELAKPGKMQGLIGNPACAVIDHEDKSAGQKQEADQVGRNRGSCVTLYLSRPKRRQPIPGAPRKFNLFSTLSRHFEPDLPVLRGARKALTLQGAPSIRPPMAAGAIPPPLFFERRGHESILAPTMAFSENTWKTHQRRSCS